MSKTTTDKSKHSIYSTIKEKTDDIEKENPLFTREDCWIRACELIADQFNSEGLESSAAQVYRHGRHGE